MTLTPQWPQTKMRLPCRALSGPAHWEHCTERRDCSSRNSPVLPDSSTCSRAKVEPQYVHTKTSA